MTVTHFVDVRLEGDQGVAKAIVQREYIDDADQRRADLYCIPSDTLPTGRVLRGVALVDSHEDTVGDRKDPEVHTAWPHGGERDDQEDNRADVDDPPAGNATRDRWADYARSQGIDDDTLTGKSRDQIRAMFADG